MDKEINKALAYMRKAKFKIEDQESIGDYLGVKIRKHSDGNYQLSHPQLINSLLKDMNFEENTKGRTTPAHSTVKVNGSQMEPTFHYRSVIGKLNYLEKSTRPKIAYPYISQEKSRQSGKKNYSLFENNKRERHHIAPRHIKCFECYANADFAGLWNIAESDDPTSARSRTGFVIMFAGIPIMWMPSYKCSLHCQLRKQNINGIPKVNLIDEFGKRNPSQKTASKSFSSQKCFVKPLRTTAEQ